MMEHRCAHRRRLDLAVLLRTPDGVVRKGCIKNVSATGAGLTVVSGTPPDGNIVELIVPSAPQTQRVRAFVVRVRGAELGLLWLEDCDWRQLSRCAEPRPHG
jgi:hypothetical protein